MGNSAGASTILYLSVAPGVPKGLWSQVIISSGVIEMDTTIDNINITYQILDLAGVRNWSLLQGVKNCSAYMPIRQQIEQKIQLKPIEN